jgi:hypothetical protein
MATKTRSWVAVVPALGRRNELPRLLSPPGGNQPRGDPGGNFRNLSDLGLSLDDVRSNVALGDYVLAFEHPLLRAVGA